MNKIRIFKNISWLFFDKIIRILGGLFIGVWVARYLGPNDFGILNYALAYTALFLLFVKLGLDQIVVRELVKIPQQTNKLLGTAFGLKIAGAFIAIIVVFISLTVIQTDSFTKIIIFLLSFNFIAQSLDVIDFFYQSKVLSKYVVIARNSAFLISSLLKIYFIINGYSVLYFAIANCLDFFIAGFLLLIIYTKTGNLISQWRFSSKIAKKFIKFCWPLAISTFLITVHMSIDQVMIGNMLDKEQVGIYSIAVRLAEAWYFIPAVIVNTLMPYFVELREKNKDLYHFRLTQLYSLMFWMGVGVGGFVIFFGEDIIGLLFGESYVGGYKALVFNIWNGIFVSQAIARGIWMISENLQQYRLYNNLIVVNLNIIINIFLIPSMGISGAAIATLLTQFSGTWIFSFLWKPLRASTWAMIKSANPMYLIRRF
jgi:O-antigen/teichoic acid export membrane protein